MAQSDSSGYRKTSGSEEGAGFRVSDKEPKKGLSGFSKGSLVALFGAAALGGGVWLADLTRDDSSPTRTFSNHEFNRAVVIDEQALFFGQKSQQYRGYQDYLNTGLVAPGDSYVKLSRDMMTVYEISPAVSNGEQGIKYVDVTENAGAVDYNDRLIVDNFMKREINSVLRQLPQLNPNFDPSIGIVKTASNGDSHTYFHIFRNEEGKGTIHIVSDDYRAAHTEQVDKATQQMQDMGYDYGIWDHGARWDAWESNIYAHCSKSADCEL